MMQKIDREYVLTIDEVKDALWTYLKAKDRPVPDRPNGLNVKWNAPGEAFVSWHDVIDFNKK